MNQKHGKEEGRKGNSPRGFSVAENARRELASSFGDW